MADACRHFAFGPFPDSCCAAMTALAIPSLLPSPEFPQRLANCSNEVLDRRLRQTEFVADLLVAPFLHHELQHIELLLGQAAAIADNLICDASSASIQVCPLSAALPT